MRADEAMVTFVKRSDHFDGVSKVFVSSVEDAQAIPPEKKEIVTTVKEKLDYAKKDIIN